jgi:membrane-associated phospholipid phosphatase
MTAAVAGRRLISYGRALGARGRRLAEGAWAGRRLAMLGLSGLSAAGFLTVYGVFVATLPGQWLDAQIFGVAQSVAQGPLSSVIPALGRQALLPFLAVVALLLGVSALFHGRLREVLFAALTIGASTGLAPVLRLRVLERPDYGWLGYPHNTMPSTHMAAVSSLVVAAVVLWNRPVRAWLVWTAAAMAALGGAGNVVGYAHLPSDVFASVFLVAALAALAGGVCGVPRSSAQPEPEAGDGPGSGP